MSTTIDCRGLACPEPVLRTKSALEDVGEEGVLTLLVDDSAARENVKRFAESQGCAVQVEPRAAGEWALTLVRGFPCEVPTTAPDAVAGAGLRTALMVTSDVLGPEPELGAVLMRAFLGTLTQATEPPARLLFLNRGVHLTTEGSEVIEVLREVEATGVEVFSCGTCLEFFGKRDQLRVGKVSNMYDTVETLTGPYKVVSVS